MGFVLLICSILCVIYWTVIFIYMKVQTTFTICLLGIGVLLGCLAFWYIYQKKRNFIHIPLWIRVSFTTILLTVGVVFFLLQLFILNASFQTPQKELDYILVLGDEVHNGKPSTLLKERLNKAIAYLRENEHTKVILCGGIMGEEKRAEAEVMALYLEEHGIETMRMMKERNSTNTVEHISFGKTLLYEDVRKKESEGKKVTIGIVTSDFHMLRAIKIAELTFHSKISGISAPSNWILRFSNMMQESFAIVKDRFLGNL